MTKKAANAVLVVKGDRSLWTAKASRSAELATLKVVPLTVAKVAEIRRDVEKAAKKDPFTSEISADALRQRLG